MLRYAVLQPGARHHYAVPAVLARAGALAAFYTDIHGDHGPLRALGRLAPGPAVPPPLRRLLARRLPPDLPCELVRDQPLATLLRPGSAAPLLRRALRERFAGAGAVYTNLVHNDLEALAQAREWGLRVVHEQFLDPAAGQLLLEEQRRYPGLDPAPLNAAPLNAAAVEWEQAQALRKWALCDRVLVPSPHCLASAVALGCDPSRLVVVPYGLPEHWLDAVSDPEPGRVLFVGQVGLRKGSHVLAAACRLLQARGVRLSCRVVGPQGVDVRHPLLAGPRYLGAMPRSRIRSEFLRADVFVLPSLAEGMALAALEAMACGVPVITTAAAGSPLRDGVDGFLVPAGDPEALADRLQQLLGDRHLRARMGAAARRRAAQFTWRQYGQRLLAALGAIGP